MALHVKEFVRFALIGGVNTVIHAVIVIMGVEALKLHPTLANTIAFFCANIASFFMNAHITFKVSPSLARYTRFLVASLATLILTITLSTLCEWMKWHYLIGLGLIILTGPILTFVLQKKWTFSKGTH